MMKQCQLKAPDSLRLDPNFTTKLIFGMTFIKSVKQYILCLSFLIYKTDYDSTISYFEGKMSTYMYNIYNKSGTC